jgi:activator of HSP90 ATPase
LITFYQLDVSVGWKAVLKKEESATITAKGNINMPYISDENDLDDFEIQITLDSEGSASTEQKELKDLVRTHSSEKLKLLIVKFLQELKAGADVADKYKEWEQEMERLEREGRLSNSQKAKPVASGTSLSNKLLEEENKKISNANIMKTVVLKENLRGPAPMIFDYFLDSNKVSIITRAKASIEKKVGGKVEMFNGQVIGEILELEENKKIVQKWRFRDWEGDHWSRLILTFEPQGDMTVVTLTQTDIPSSQEKRVEGGWNNIFNGMKMMLGQVISSGF